MEPSVPPQVGVRVRTLAKMTLDDAITEVFGDMTPRPTSTEVRVRAWYEMDGTTMLEEPNDFVAFAHVVLAAAFTQPTHMGRQMIVGTSVAVFCARRGIKIDTVG